MLSSKNTKSDINNIIDNIRSRINAKNTPQSALEKIDKKEIAPILAQLSGAEKSTEQLLSLANMFDVLADLKIKLGDITKNERSYDDKTNALDNLEYYNQAAIRLQYVRKIITFNELNEHDGIRTENSVDSARTLLREMKTKLITIHQKLTQKIESEYLDNTIKTDNTDRNELANLILEDKFSYKGLFKELRHEMHVASEQPIEILNAHRYCTSITANLKGYLALLFHDAERVLAKSQIGTAPCNYAVLGIGSMALQQSTPYSDLEFIILTQDETYKNNINPNIKNYFQLLTNYVHFKVIMLGETPIPISDYDLNLDYLIKPGIRFDPGRKTPLGKINGDTKYCLIQTVDKMLEYVKNEKGEIEKIDRYLPFVLEASCFIHGDQTLATSYKDKVSQFLTNNDVAKNRAIKRLERGVSKFLVVGQLEEFAFHASDHHGKIFNVKQEIYRLADRFIYNLGLICGISNDEGGVWNTIDLLQTNSVLFPQAAENLKKALSFATMLRIKLYDFYEHQNERMDTRTITHNDRTQSNIFHLTPELRIKLFEYYYIVFPLMNRLSDFCEQYNVNKSLPKDFFINNTTLTSEIFFQNDNYTEGKIYLRLSAYYAALKCFKQLFGITEVLESATSNLPPLDQTSTLSDSTLAALYHDAGVTCHVLTRFKQARVFFEKSVQLKKEKNIQKEKIQNSQNLLNTQKDDHENNVQLSPVLTISTDNIDNHDKNNRLNYQKQKTLIISLNNLSLTLINLEEYKEAYDKLSEAYKSDETTNKENSVCTLYNLGKLYCLYAEKSFQNSKIMNYLDKAYICFEYMHSLMKNSPKYDNLYEAQYLIGIGTISYIKGKAPGMSIDNFWSIMTCVSKALDRVEMHKALNYQENALEIFYETYDTHPIISETLHQVAKTYYQLRDFENWKIYEKKSLSIYERLFEANHALVKESRSINNSADTKIIRQKFYNFFTDHATSFKTFVCCCFSSFNIIKAKNAANAALKVVKQARKKNDINAQNINDPINSAKKALDVAQTQIIREINEITNHLTNEATNLKLDKKITNVVLNILRTVEANNILADAIETKSKLNNITLSNGDNQDIVSVKETAEKIAEQTNNLFTKICASSNLPINIKTQVFMSTIEALNSANNLNINTTGINTQIVQDANTQIINIIDTFTDTDNGNRVVKQNIIDTGLIDAITSIIKASIIFKDVSGITSDNNTKTTVEDATKAVINKIIDTDQGNLADPLITTPACLRHCIGTISKHQENMQGLVKMIQQILDEQNSWITYGLTSTSTQQVSALIDIKYNNNILNHPELLQIAYKIGGVTCVNKLIDLGEDQELANAIIDATTEQSATSVISVIFQTEQSNICLFQDELYYKDPIDYLTLIGDHGY